MHPPDSSLAHGEIAGMGLRVSKLRAGQPEHPGGCRDWVGRQAQRQQCRFRLTCDFRRGGSSSPLTAGRSRRARLFRCQRGYSTRRRPRYAGLGHQLRQGSFSTDHDWDRMADSWHHRLPLPSPALARERAARTHERLVRVLEFGDEDAAHEQAVSYLTHLARAQYLSRLKAGVGFPTARQRR